MLRELRARAHSFDASKRTLRIEVAGGAGSPRAESGAVLLDRRGRVVGVDVQPDAPSRVVVLIGAHEDVERTEPRSLTVARDARGDVAFVLVPDVAGG